MPKKILITGGAGFIGRWLAKKAIEAGYLVWVYDNLSVAPMKNLVELEGRYTLVQADILDTETLTTLLRQESIRTLYHLAAFHYIPFCESHPSLTMRVNVEGTTSVLEAAKQAGIDQLIFASTGALYPSVDEDLDEDMPLSTPADIYGLSKWIGEQLVEYYHRRYGVPCTIVRLFNTYGPYETNPHLLPHIMESLKVNPYKLELGNIKPKRDYVYVEDVADALLRLAQPREQLEVFNIGTGKEYSVEEIVALLSELLGHEIEIRQDPSRMRPVDKMHQRARIERITTATGWTPQFGIRAGLSALLKHERLLTE